MIDMFDWSGNNASASAWHSCCDCYLEESDTVCGKIVINRRSYRSSVTKMAHCRKRCVTDRDD